MTCQWNEAVALNTLETKKLVTTNGVIALKADKTDGSLEVDAMLVELGNKAKGIPFCVIYPADGGEPMILPTVLSESTVLEALKNAGPSQGKRGAAATVMRSTGPVN